MSSFDDEDSNPHRFLPQNSILEPERYIFDVSNIPVGDLLRLESQPGESTPDSQELLRRNLFPELSPIRPDIADNDPTISDTETRMNIEIVHSEVGHELWKRRRTEKTATTFSCTVARNHHYMDELRKIVEAETSEALGVE